MPSSAAMVIVSGTSIFPLAPAVAVLPPPTAVILIASGPVPIPSPPAAPAVISAFRAICPANIVIEPLVSKFSLISTENALTSMKSATPKSAVSTPPVVKNPPMTKSPSKLMNGDVGICNSPAINPSELSIIICDVSAGSIANTKSPLTTFGNRILLAPVNRALLISCSVLTPFRSRTLASMLPPRFSVVALISVVFVSEILPSVVTVVADIVRSCPPPVTLPLSVTVGPAFRMVAAVRVMLPFRLRLVLASRIPPRDDVPLMVILPVVDVISPTATVLPSSRMLLLANILPVKEVVPLTVIAPAEI